MIIAKRKRKATASGPEKENLVPGDEDVSDEEEDVGDEKREEAARETDAEEVHEPSGL